MFVSRSLNDPATCKVYLRVCLLKFKCCHTDIEVPHQTCCVTRSQYTDTRPTGPIFSPGHSILTPGQMALSYHPVTVYWHRAKWSYHFTRSQNTDTNVLTPDQMVLSSHPVTVYWHQAKWSYPFTRSQYTDTRPNGPILSLGHSILIPGQMVLSSHPVTEYWHQCTDTRPNGPTVSLGHSILIPGQKVISFHSVTVYRLRAKWSYRFTRSQYTVSGPNGPRRASTRTGLHVTGIIQTGNGGRGRDTWSVERPSQARPTHGSCRYNRNALFSVLCLWHN